MYCTLVRVDVRDFLHLSPIMHRFARQSVLPKNLFVKYEFGAGLGYHVSSAASRTLLGRLSILTSNTTYESLVLQDNERDNGHVRSLMKGHEIEEHTSLNIHRADMYDIDQFFLSTDMALDTACYASVVSTNQGGRQKVIFQRQPFQQFMMLDSIFVMIDRSGLSEHRAQILMHIKSKLGYDWLTCSKAHHLQHLFSIRVIGHNIRRRMGKSVAVYAELARCLAFFPLAGIKALYTVHSSHAARECHSAVSSSIEKFVEVFNKKQREMFQQRIHARGGTIDPHDFYYQAKHLTLLTSASIKVIFHKLNREGDCNNRKPVSQNTLLCKGYTQQDVSTCFLNCFYYIISSK